MTGSQEACRFHDEEDYHVQKSPNGTLKIVPVESYLILHENGTLDWTKAYHHDPKQYPFIVYSVVYHTAGSWTVIGQTIETHLQVEKQLDQNNFRVLGVNSYGLVCVFRTPEILPGNLNTKNDSWNLHINSIVHQKVLVLTEIGWDVPKRIQNQYSTQTSNDVVLGKDGDNPSSERLIFLLTWEMHGGLVRGNLVTDVRTVTISLWPNTAYTIQVCRI